MDGIEPEKGMTGVKDGGENEMLLGMEKISKSKGMAMLLYTPSHQPLIFRGRNPNVSCMQP